MTSTFTSVAALSDGPLQLRRAGVALAVVAAHVMLILMLSKGTRHQPAEVVEITLFDLSITPEEEEGVPELEVPRASDARPSARSQERAASPSASPDAESSRAEAAKPETETVDGDANPKPITPDASLDALIAPTDVPVDTAPIDWFAAARTSAAALKQRQDTEAQRRTLAGPNQPPLRAPKKKQACPFEHCEPGWDGEFSVFESSKAGRIEKAADDEVIRWISNRCYQILVSPNPMHKAMTKCVTPLDKAPARGDLFKHMHEAPPPPERATDVP